jgi:hypothetical protein
VAGFCEYGDESSGSGVTELVSVLLVNRRQEVRMQSFILSKLIYCTNINNST